MQGGTDCPGREAPRAYRADTRAIRIQNVQLRRVGAEMEVRFDLELDDWWRHPPDSPVGNFNAVWLFLKTRSSSTMRDCTQQELLNALAPTAHLSKSLADEVLDRARRRLDAAMQQLSSYDATQADQVGPAAFLNSPDFAPTALDIATQHLHPPEPDKVGEVTIPGAEAEDQGDKLRARYLNVTREVLRSEAGSRSPGVMSARKEIITLVARPKEEGDTAYDCKQLGPWRHARLSPDSAKHTAPFGCEIVAAEDGMGVFVQRSADNPGAGPARISGVVLRWVPPEDIEFPVRVWVHPVEMVYVPEGAYELGDPQGIEGPTGCFHSSIPRYLASGAKNWVYRVASDGEIPVCDVTEHLADPPHLTWDNRGQFGTQGNIPATFPNGYGAFYCMRRQLTQGEFCDFINSLSGHAKTSRFPYGGQGDYRYTVYKTEGGLRAATRPNRANNWMSWADAIAWMWWAGLRPMTELEFEKACRGFGEAVAEEFAWGNTVLEEANIIIGDEALSECVSGNGHLNNPHNQFMGGDEGYGPVRDDAFLLPGTALSDEFSGGGYAVFGAQPDGTGFVDGDIPDVRVATGASYFGIMALTGNLWEFVITAGHDLGRRFTGVHGDGELNQVGLPKWVNDPPETMPWPDAGSVGTGFRGGSWYTAAKKGRLADRSHGAGLEGYNARSHDTGVRAVRTAPKP